MLIFNLIPFLPFATSLLNVIKTLDSDYDFSSDTSEKSNLNIWANSNFHVNSDQILLNLQNSHIKYSTYSSSMNPYVMSDNRFINKRSVNKNGFTNDDILSSIGPMFEMTAQTELNISNSEKINFLEQTIQATNTFKNDIDNTFNVTLNKFNELKNKTLELENNDEKRSQEYKNLALSCKEIYKNYRSNINKTYGQLISESGSIPKTLSENKLNVSLRLFSEKNLIYRLNTMKDVLENYNNLFEVFEESLANTFAILSALPIIEKITEKDPLEILNKAFFNARDYIYIRIAYRKKFPYKQAHRKYSWLDKKEIPYPHIKIPFPTSVKLKAVDNSYYLDEWPPSENALYDDIINALVFVANNNYELNKSISKVDNSIATNKLAETIIIFSSANYTHENKISYKYNNVFQETANKILKISIEKSQKVTIEENKYIMRVIEQDLEHLEEAKYSLENSTNFSTTSTNENLLNTTQSIVSFEPMDIIKIGTMEEFNELSDEFNFKYKSIMIKCNTKMKEIKGKIEGIDENSLALKDYLNFISEYKAIFNDSSSETNSLIINLFNQYDHWEKLSNIKINVRRRMFIQFYNGMFFKFFKDEIEKRNIILETFPNIQKITGKNPFKIFEKSFSNSEAALYIKFNTEKMTIEEKDKKQLNIDIQVVNNFIREAKDKNNFKNELSNVIIKYYNSQYIHENAPKRSNIVKNLILDVNKLWGNNLEKNLQETSSNIEKIKPTPQSTISIPITTTLAPIQLLENELSQITIDIQVLDETLNIVREFNITMNGLIEDTSQKLSENEVKFISNYERTSNSSTESVKYIIEYKNVVEKFDEHTVLNFSKLRKQYDEILKKYNNHSKLVSNKKVLTLFDTKFFNDTELYWKIHDYPTAVFSKLEGIVDIIDLFSTMQKITSENPFVTLRKSFNNMEANIYISVDEFMNNQNTTKPNILSTFYPKEGLVNWPNKLESLYYQVLKPFLRFARDSDSWNTTLNVNLLEEIKTFYDLRLVDSIITFLKANLTHPKQKIRETSITPFKDILVGLMYTVDNWIRYEHGGISSRGLSEAKTGFNLLNQDSTIQEITENTYKILEHKRAALFIRKSELKKQIEMWVDPTKILKKVSHSSKEINVFDDNFKQSDGKHESNSNEGNSWISFGILALVLLVVTPSVVWKYKQKRNSDIEDIEEIKLEPLISSEKQSLDFDKENINGINGYQKLSSVQQSLLI